MPRLIDADALKEWIENWFVKNAYYHPYSKSNNIPIPELYDILERMPTVEAEPVKQERCEFCKDGKTFLGAVLVLGNDGNWHSIRYCPNCGAKMDVETGNTYSIGKIELPKGVFRQIYDEERREDGNT